MARAVTVFRDAILALDLRHDFGQQRLAELGEILVTQFGTAPGAPGGADHFHGAVTEGHYDDHGFRFALRDQVVEYDVRTAHGRPSAGIVAEPMQQIQHWIRRLRRGIVTGRRVDVVVTMVGGHVRCVEVMMNFAVRNIVEFPRQR